MAKSNTPYLVVEGLAKHYGDGEARMQVLDGMTTTVNRGEICIMLGPSGSGKSTFLNLIGGLEGADGGTISVGNCELTALSNKDLGEYRPRQVSGGQQQRCAIGRALVKNPGLILCDEPTGALDYKTSKEVLELMEHVNRKYGCTLVIVTHNAAIARMADRVLRLRDGRLAEDEVNNSPVPASELDW